MNWKRGLTRVYVVLWILVAILGVFLAYSNSDTALRPRRELREFLDRNTGVVSLTDLRSLDAKTLGDRVLSARLAKTGPIMLRSPTGEVRTVNPTEYDIGALLRNGYTSEAPALQDLKADYEGLTPLVRAQMCARRDTAAMDIVWVWVQWILYCGLAPGVVLAIVGWVWAGFERSSSPKA